MRSDMSKVIVERPRVGHKSKYHEVRQRLRVQDYEDEDYEVPHRGMRRPYNRGERKELNENLQPLRRFLQKQVGRPWDKVYSEIRANVGPDNAVQMHIVQHLKWMVDTDPRRIEEDKERYANRQGSRPVNALYVDPEDGILKQHKFGTYAARRKTARTTETADVFQHPNDQNTYFRKINGTWHEVRYAWFSEKALHHDPLYPHVPSVQPGRVPTFLDKRKAQYHTMVRSPEGKYEFADVNCMEYLVPYKALPLSRDRIRKLKLPV